MTKKYLHRKTIAAASAVLALAGAGSAFAFHSASSFALDVPVEELGELPGKGDAYISKARVLEITDGTAPWDANSSANGNDDSPSNKRVRSFDTITYDLEYTVTPAATASHSYYKNARVGFRVVIPFSSDKQAEFMLGEMGWTDSSEGYEPKVTVENVNGVQSQVLTCYRRLEPTRRIPATVPGTATVSFPLYMKMVNNSTNVRPDVYVWVEGADNDEHSSLYGNAYGYKVTPDNVVVTATPKYNVRLVANTHSYSRGVFPFGTEGNSLAQNKSRGNVEGRLFGFSPIVELYNDRTDKGLKGIEIPTGNISFNLNLSSRLTVPTPTNRTYDVSATHTPLLWGFSENESNATTRDGRTLNKNGNTYFYNPGGVYNRLSAHASAQSRSAYNGGTWTATQSGRVLSCQISGFEIDPDHFPSQYTNTGGGVYPIYNPENGQTSVGVFSCGNIWLVQPFHNSTNGKYVFDEYTATWEATFNVAASVSNFRATSASGQAYTTQMVSADDTCSFNQNLRVPGGYSTFVTYTYPENISGGESGTDRGTWTQNYNDGTDYATLGSKVRMLWGARINPSDQDNRKVAENSLLKFDDKRLEYDPNGGGFGANRSQALSHATFYFAAKPDKTGWRDDAEQKSTKIDGLIYFKNYNELVSKGYKCVGFLVCERWAWDDSTPLVLADVRYTVPMKVTSNASYAQTVAMCTIDDYCWTRLSIMNHTGRPATSFTLADYQNYVDANFKLPAGNGDRIPAMPMGYRHHYDGGAVYDKSVYDSNGYAGGHTGSMHNGDSLYILSEVSRISKTVAQCTSETPKRVYDMDYQQRVVDYRLNLSVLDSNGNASSSRTTLTITDTLSASLTYIPYSSYYGGTYHENTPSAGSVENPLSSMEPTVTKNADGTTTLKWVIPNVDPRTLQNIHYSCRIGVEGHPTKDVKNNEQITSTATIRSSYDFRDLRPVYGNVSANTISISKLRQQSLSISGAPFYNEQNADLNFVSYVGNYGNANLVDAFGINMMPYNGDPEGSHYNGDWTLSSMQLDREFCSDFSDVAVYFTNDVKYRDMDSADIPWDEVRDTWARGTVNASTGVVTIPSGFNHPVAWAITDDLLASKAVLAMKQTLRPSGNKCEDRYSMTLTDGDNTVDAALSVVTREIRGQAWADWNLDDIKDEGDKGIPGVKVRLVNASGATVINHDGKACEMVTGEDGTYVFEKVPAGTFSVVFTKADGTNFLGYEGVIKDYAAAGDARDNDADYTWVGSGQYEASQMRIPNLPFPSPADMYEVRYELSDCDAALKPLGRDLVLYKADMDDHNWKLANTEFSVRGTSLAGFPIDASAASDENGKLAFGFVPFGTYEMTETKRAYQHLGAPCTWTVTIAKGDVLTVESGGHAMQDATRGNDDIRILNEMMKPDIDLTKTVTNVTTGKDADNLQDGVTEPAHIGDVLEYEITVTNTGNCDLYRVTMDDKMLASFNNIMSSTLHAGESVKFKKQLIVDEDDAIAKALDNVATVWAIPPDDLPTVRDRDEVLTNVVANPSIHVVKSSDKTFIADAKPGDVIVYDFVVTNTGDITLSNVQLPDWMTATGKLGYLHFPSRLFHPDDAPVNLTSQYVITQSDIDRGYVRNSVKATGVEPVDKVTVESDVSSVKTLLEQKPAIKVAKEVDKESAGIGEDLHYSFVITNVGNVTLKDVKLDDELLGTHGHNVADALEPGDSVTYTTWTTGYYTTVEEDVYGDGRVVNMASVKGKAPNGKNIESEDEADDPWGEPAVYVTDEDDAVTHVTEEPALKITKDVDVSPVVSKAGDSVTWRFTVENTGNVTVEDIAIEDDMLTARGVDVTLDKDTLAPGEKATGSAVMRTTQEDIDAGVVENVAVATGKSSATGTDVQSSPDDAELPIAPAPALSVEKSRDLEEAHIGDVIHYTIKVINTGNVTLSDITLDDETASVAGYRVADVLAPGESAEVYAERAVVEGDIVDGKVKNVASVSAKTPAGDDVEKDSNEVETKVIYAPAIELVKTVDAKVVSPARAGQRVKWSFAVTNTGDVTLYDIAIDDPMLDVLDDAEPIVGENVKLAPGETVTYDVDYELTQDDVDNGEVTNVAVARGSDAAGKDVDDDAETSVKVERTNGISLTKSVDKSFIANAEASMVLTYDFVVTNTGNVTASDISIADDIASVKAVIDWSTKEGNSPGQVLAPGESVHAKGTYSITDEDIFSGQVDNTAKAYAKAPKDTSADENDGETGDVPEPDDSIASDGDDDNDVIPSGDDELKDIESNEAEAVTMLEIAPPMVSGVADDNKGKQALEARVAPLGESIATLIATSVAGVGIATLVVLRRKRSGDR